ncbi:MAG: FecR family protein [Deltaproteobacteria bacterium]|nr:FecR family protein [Deltaproteobacteria bacterium]
MDHFLNKMKEWSGRYKEDIKTVEDWATERIKELKVWLCKKMHPGKCNIIPHAVIGTRGTRFVIDRIGEYEAKVIVFEGAVEISIPEFKENLIIDRENEAILYSDGTVIFKTRSSLNQLQRYKAFLIAFKFL